MSPIETLIEGFHAAVAAAKSPTIIPPNLPSAVSGRNVVLGAGKASAAMARALEEHWTGQLEGLVVTRYGHSVSCQKIEIIEAAHPVPDANGHKAALRMLDIAEGLGPEDQVIALVSGGGSALLTCMPDGISQTDQKVLNAALLSSGASIDEINCIRRHLSQISGGRLAAQAFPAKTTALLISDVPGDDPMNIASGPTVADSTTLADARSLIAKYGLSLPESIRRALNDPVNESIKHTDPRVQNTFVKLVATPKDSLQAAARKLIDLGYAVETLGDALEGEARVLGRQHAQHAISRQSNMQPNDKPIIILSGGETTVTLPSNDKNLGTGGRNVDYLLGFALACNGAPGIYALAADTDGIDGMADVAGGFVTPDTIERAAKAGANLVQALERFDGHGFFEALGDQIVTGPTLTNVNDFRAIMITPKT